MSEHIRVAVAEGVGLGPVRGLVGRDLVADPLLAAGCVLALERHAVSVPPGTTPETATPRRWTPEGGDPHPPT